MSTQRIELTNAERRKKQRMRIFETVIFAMLAALMFCSKILMEFLPNIHLLGMLTMTYTLVFRAKALIPIYLYVFLNGLYAGFDLWWMPYLYIWTLLWGATMLMPKNMKRGVAAVVYPALCALHGLLFGILYSPAQALLFNLSAEGWLAWIIAGFGYDIIHAVGNLIVGLFVLPMSVLLKRLWQKAVG